MDQAVIQTIMSTFTPTWRFWQKYDRLFQKDPVAANVLLLLAELTDELGVVKLPASNPGAEIVHLMDVRFSDPRAYRPERETKP